VNTTRVAEIRSPKPQGLGLFHFSSSLIQGFQHEKSIKSPSWLSQAKTDHSGLIGGLSSVARPQPLAQRLLPRSLNLNLSFEIKYRR
jgi:hypothetical protein